MPKWKNSNETFWVIFKHFGTVVKINVEVVEDQAEMFVEQEDYKQVGIPTL